MLDFAKVILSIMRFIHAISCFRRRRRRRRLRLTLDREVFRRRRRPPLPPRRRLALGVLDGFAVADGTSMVVVDGISVVVVVAGPSPFTGLFLVLHGQYRATA